MILHDHARLLLAPLSVPGRAALLRTLLSPTADPNLLARELLGLLRDQANASAWLPLHGVFGSWLLLYGAPIRLVLADVAEARAALAAVGREMNIDPERVQASDWSPLDLARERELLAQLELEHSLPAGRLRLEWLYPTGAVTALAFR